MRRVFTIVFCLISIAVAGQYRVTGHIYDSTTRKPLAGLYFYILRDNDKWIDINTTDSSGCFTGEIEKKEYSKKSSYQVYIESDKYNIVKRAVNLENYADDTIFLSHNPRYADPGNEMMFIEASSTSFGDYEPAEPRSMNELPEKIQKKVESHLLDKTGPVFYSRLYLSGGQLVNLQRLEKLEHFSRDYHWRAYPYYLNFSFTDTSLGIARYTAKLVMDEEGNVMEDIELPCIRDSSYKETIISMRDAKAQARGLGYYTDSTYTEFKFDSERDCFTWEFATYEKDRKEWTYHNKELVLNAHNGKIISTEESSGCMPSGNGVIKFGKLFVTMRL